MTHDPTTTRASRGLVALLATQTLSTVGSTTTGLALALWLYQDAGSVTLLGVLFLASSLPAVLVGPYAGSVVDRLPRRVTMLGADTVAGLATAGALAAVVLGGLEPVHLVLVAVTGSLAGAFQEPAYAAVIADNADDDQLERLNGLVQFGPAVGIVAGPALAGILLAVGGLRSVLLVDLATFAVAVATLALLRFADERPDAPERPKAPRVREGWSVLRDDPGLLHITFTGTAVNLLFGFVNLLLVPLLLGIGSTVSAGFTMSVTGIGMLIGTLVVAAVGRRGRPGAVLGWGLAGLGLGVVVAGLRPALPLVALGSLLLALPAPAVNAVSRSLAQRAVAPEVLGRVMALRRTLATAALPIAHVAAGPLADRLFEPWLADGGALAATLGRVIGTGPGRGAAAIFVVAGLGVIVLGARLANDPSVRDLERRIDAARPGRAATGQPAMAVEAVS